MSQQDMEAVAQRLATIRDIIMDREGDDVQDQFEIAPFIIIVNIEGSGYSDDEDVFTLVQVERGPAGMEELIACAVEDQNEESYIITSEDDNLLDQLEEACDKVYRHWHWLDMPNALPGSEMQDEDDLDDDENI